MEHVYAALLLSAADEELNQRNLTAVLEAANCSVTESRTRALVAALEDVDVTEVGDQSAGDGPPAGAESTPGSGTGAGDAPPEPGFEFAPDPEAGEPAADDSASTE